MSQQRTRLANNRHILRSVAALFGGNITTSFLGAIGGLLVARYLGPEVTGRFRVYTIPLMYLTFLHLGTFDGLWRQIPYYTGKEMPEKVASVASAAGAWNALVSGLVAPILFGSAFRLACGVAVGLAASYAAMCLAGLAARGRRR